MAYRKANGLCYKCGFRWGQTHKCNAIVPLKLVEEVQQILETSVPPKQKSMPQEDSGDNLMFCPSMQCKEHSLLRLSNFWQPCSLKLLLCCRFQQFILLYHSALTALSSNVVPLPLPVLVRVANGQLISCTSYLPQCKVTLQGHTFYTNLKILPLQCYDVILDMDWLSSHSSMQVHQQDKWLTFFQDQNKLTLQGQLSDCCNLEPISASQLNHLAQHDELWCTMELQQVSNL